MKTGKSLPILGMLGVIIFYLISSGCAMFNIGGVKTELGRKLHLPEGTQVKSVCLKFSSEKPKKDFEAKLSRYLALQGYTLVKDAADADVELMLEYTATPMRKKEVYIIFLIPLWTTIDVTAYKVKALFTTRNARDFKQYQAEYDFSINYAIVHDLSGYKPKTDAVPEKR
jgi:hypothetical protein